jgi:DNA ligase (NAD+)
VSGTSKRRPPEPDTSAPAIPRSPQEPSASAPSAVEPFDQPHAHVLELRAQLEHHGHRYYVLDDPEIADDAYDALLDELRTLESEHPELLSPDSPTQRVGGEPVGRLEKVNHLEPMLSLGNVRGEQELRAWVAKG